MGTTESYESIDENVIDGARKLVSEIIRKAIDDYKILESRGWVNGGQIKPEVLAIRKDARRRRIVCGFMSVWDVFNLIDFLWSEELEAACRLTQLNITASSIRSVLGLPEDKPSFERMDEIRDARLRRNQKSW